MNIPALYFCRSDLYRRSHVATSLSREKSSNLHFHSSCIHQNPTNHRNKAYLLNQWIDLMYLIPVDLPGILISESRTSTSSYSQVYMDLPSCMHLIILSYRICTHPIILLSCVCIHPIVLLPRVCLRT